jgi:hypothetical protein
MMIYALAEMWGRFFVRIVRLTKFLNGEALNEAFERQLYTELNFVSLSPERLGTLKNRFGNNMRCF